MSAEAKAKQIVSKKIAGKPVILWVAVAAAGYFLYTRFKGSSAGSSASGTTLAPGTSGTVGGSGAASDTGSQSGTDASSALATTNSALLDALISSSTLVAGLGQQAADNNAALEGAIINSYWAPPGDVNAGLVSSSAEAAAITPEPSRVPDAVKPEGVADRPTVPAVPDYGGARPAVPPNPYATATDLTPADTTILSQPPSTVDTGQALADNHATVTYTTAQLKSAAQVGLTKAGLVKQAKATVAKQNRY